MRPLRCPTARQIVVAALIVAPSSSSGAAQVTPATCPGAWSAQRDHPTSPSESVFVPVSEAARLAGGIGLFDDRAVSWTTGSPRPRLIPAAGLFIDRTGRVARIEYPGGDARYRYPIAASDAFGRAHVVYGTAGEDTAYVPLPVVDTLWYAIHDGRSWSRPTAIWSGSALQWMPVSRSALVVVGDTAHLAASVPARASAGGAYVLYLRGSGTTWTASRIDTPTGGGYPALVLLAPRAPAVAYTGAVRDTMGGFDVNSVFVVRSTDGGTTWSVPELIRRSGRNRARLLEAAGGIDRPAYLLWAHTSPEEEAADRDTLGVVRLGAAETTRLASVRTDAAIGALAATVDARGDLHVLAWDQRRDSARLVHRRFDSNPWTERAPAVVDDRARPGAILTLSRDSLYAAWVHTPVAPRTPVVRSATFARDCPTR